MTSKEKLRRFEETISPHLGPAYNVAMWLTRNHHDAEDIVQEAFLRAFSSLEGFRGEDGKPWLLAIVRNTAMTWMKRNRGAAFTTEFDDAMEDPREPPQNPETLLLASLDRASVRKAVEELPPEFREAIVLRELEGLSYKDIASITGAPLGTVMSRLSRGREWLRKLLAGPRKEAA